MTQHGPRAAAQKPATARTGVCAQWLVSTLEIPNLGGRRPQAADPLFWATQLGISSLETSHCARTLVRAVAGFCAAALESVLGLLVAVFPFYMQLQNRGRVFGLCLGALLPVAAPDPPI